MFCSYSGYEWEGIPPSPLQPTCSNSGCSVNLNDVAYVYRIDALNRPVKREAKFDTARFLAQTTFGASRHDLSEFESKYTASMWCFNEFAGVHLSADRFICEGYSRLHDMVAFASNLLLTSFLLFLTVVAGALSGMKKWIEDQIDMEPTYLRAYWRQRANPRVDVHNFVRYCIIVNVDNEQRGRFCSPTNTDFCRRV